MKKDEKAALLNLLRNPILPMNRVASPLSFNETLSVSTILIVVAGALLTGAAFGLHFNGVAL